MGEVLAWSGLRLHERRQKPLAHERLRATFLFVGVGVLMMSTACDAMPCLECAACVAGAEKPVR